MKSIAVFLGYGPDVDFLLANRSLVPDDAELFRLNVRNLAQDEQGLTLVNPISWDMATSMLKDRQFSKVVTFGSLRFRVIDARGLLQGPGAYSKFIELLPHIASRSSSSDAGRLHILSKLEADFEFPPLIDVLPCLFATEAIAINPNRELLDRALQDQRSYQKDAFFEIDGARVKVFRVASGELRNLINRRLDPAKLRQIHTVQKAQCYFFDRKRTTLVGIEEMKAYALDNDLTFQSFNDDD